MHGCCLLLPDVSFCNIYSSINRNVSIKLLKNKAIRYELKFKQIDNEMFEAFTSKFNPDILESMQDLWKNECNFGLNLFGNTGISLSSHVS
jgi:hypothetical protein